MPELQLQLYYTQVHMLTHTAVTRHTVPVNHIVVYRSVVVKKCIGRENIKYYIYLYKFVHVCTPGTTVFGNTCV